MGIFNKILKKSDKPIEERNVVELMETVPWVSAMNESSIVESFKKGENEFYLNPNNQTCFNFGWFTHQDFINWANGTGVIVKGETQEEKDKVMKYAKSYTELNFLIFSYGEHLDLFDTSEILHGRSYYTGSKYFQDLSKVEDSEIVIKKFWSDLARQVKEKLESKISYERSKADWYDNYTPDIKSIVDQVYEWTRVISFEKAHTLSILGHGYFGACNTPCDIENLAWSKDLAFAIGYKEWLKEDGYELPDFKWVLENRYSQQD